MRAFLLPVCPGCQASFRFVRRGKMAVPQQPTTKGKIMHISSYQQAIEITKIILQSNPERLVRSGQIPSVDRAKSLAVFIKTLGDELDKIETHV